MYNNDGQVVASTKDTGVQFEGYPLGVSYDPQESAIIVTDRKARLTLLLKCDSAHFPVYAILKFEVLKYIVLHMFTVQTLNANTCISATTK